MCLFQSLSPPSLCLASPRLSVWLYPLQLLMFGFITCARVVPLLMCELTVRSCRMFRVTPPPNVEVQSSERCLLLGPSRLAQRSHRWNSPVGFIEHMLKWEVGMVWSFCNNNTHMSHWIHTEGDIDHCDHSSVPHWLLIDPFTVKWDRFQHLCSV